MPLVSPEAAAMKPAHTPIQQDRTTPYCTTPAARVPNPRPSCRSTARPIWPNAITSAITSAIHRVTE